MFNNETVSVIIPVYNGEKYLGETIESVLNQTYHNIEIIIVDDCSTDNSRKIVEAYLKKYKNITYYLQPQNAGAAVARNKGLELAKGRYIAFLDSDDLWYPQKIEKQIDVMKSKNLAFCYTAYEMINEDGVLIKEKVKIVEEAKYKHLLKRTVISTPTVVLDRNLIGDLKMPLRRTGQDYAFWLLLLRHVPFAYGIDEALVKVRKRGLSLSSNKFQNIVDVWSVQTKLEKINPVYAAYNTCCYVINAFLKRFF